MRPAKIIVVGGGLAGLMATIRVAESTVPVDLFSIVPVKRSHSVCAQGGINAAKNQKGEGDTTAKHFDDTIYGGNFLYRRNRRDFWPLDKLGGVHGLGAIGAFPAGRGLRQRRIHPSPPDSDSRRRQTPLDERIGAWRRRPRMCAKKSR